MVWFVSAQKVTADESQQLVSITADLSTNTPPAFHAMTREVVEDKDGNEKHTGRVIVKEIGTVQHIYGDSTTRSIYKCTMFCTITASIPVAVGTKVAPVPDSTGTLKVRLKFHLYSIRARPRLIHTQHLEGIDSSPDYRSLRL